MKQDEMVKTLEQNAKLFSKAYSEITNDEAETIKVNSQWTMRDEAAHIVSWLEEFDKEIRYIATHGAGKIPWVVTTDASSSAYDAWNQDRIDAMKGIRLGDLRKRYERENERFIRLVEALTDEQLTWVAEIPWENKRLAIPELISVHEEHERYHVQRSWETWKDKRRQEACS